MCPDMMMIIVTCVQITYDDDHCHMCPDMMMIIVTCVQITYDDDIVTFVQI